MTLKCPYPCGLTLTKDEFSDKTAEEREFRRETEIRRRLAVVFNLRFEDFAGRREEWHKYCERRETLVMALVTGTEAEQREAERAVEEYRRTHTTEISCAAARRSAEDTAEQQADRADLSERKAKADAVAEKEARAARVAQEVRNFKVNLSWGEVGAPFGGGAVGAAAAGGGGAAGGASSAAGLAKVKERLLAIKAKRAADAKARICALPSLPPPCPHIPLPQLNATGLLNKGWTALPLFRLPKESLPSHWRASGWDASASFALEKAELCDMLCE